MGCYYFTYQHIHQVISQAAEKILHTGFVPDIMLAIGGGGFIPGRILRTFIKKPLYTINVSYYDADNKPSLMPKKIQWIKDEDIASKKILLIDEVDDTRITLQYCLEELLKQKPEEIGVFILHSKNKPKQGRFPEAISKVFIGEEIADRWIRYPWDALDINDHYRLKEEHESGRAPFLQPIK